MGGRGVPRRDLCKGVDIVKRKGRSLRGHKKN